jgi:RNA polymerase sigma-70 factor (ECF subfamily)
VAGNLIRNSGRHTQRDAMIMAALTPSAEPDHAETVNDRQVALGVLAKLSDSDQELLRLVAWEGLAARQVAAVLGCGRAAVYLRLHRLRKRLERSC